MLVLFESAAGYGLFKVRNEGKISEPGDLYKEFQSAEAAANLVEAQVFQKFADTAEAQFGFMTTSRRRILYVKHLVFFVMPSIFCLL